ncbi:hypothetical protein PMIN06_000023 [Paraphaeosphaeria minitans]
MIRSFRALEYPFLKPEFRDLDAAHWSTNTPRDKGPAYLQSPPAGSPWEDDDGEQAQAQGLRRSNRFGSDGYKKCGVRERWLWLHRKGDVVTMSERLSRIEVRRTAHEVGAVAMAVADIGRDIEGVFEVVRAMEGRLKRVVGVRRVE